MNPAQLLDPKGFAKQKQKQDQPPPKKKRMPLYAFAALIANSTTVQQPDKIFAVRYPDSIRPNSLLAAYPHSASLNMDFVPEMGYASVFENAPGYRDTMFGEEFTDLTDTGPKQMRKETAASNTESTPSAPTYDPKALLAPRSSAKSSASAQSQSQPKVEAPAINGHDASGQATENEDGGGMSSFLEKAHGLVSRAEVAPQRKRKSEVNGEEDEERKKHKGAFSGITSGGIIGEHMKEERKRANANALPPDTVDLTGDDPETNDVVFVSENSKEEICMGQISVDVAANCVPEPTAGTANNLHKDFWPRMKVNIHREKASNNIISVSDRKGVKFGRIDIRTATPLCQLLDGQSISKLRIKAYLDHRPKKPGESPGQQISRSLKMTCVLYAPRDKAKSIGRFLSQRLIFLNNPFMVDHGKKVVNPQAPEDFTPPRDPVTGRTSGRGGAPSSTALHVTRTQEEIRREASTMFDNLTKNEEIPETDLTDTNIITTSLMAHQKQALNFLLEHERSDYDYVQDSPKFSLWKPMDKPNGQQVFYNVITGHELLEKPPTVHGGILADMMGLGKTLSILALIAETRNDARTFHHQDTSPDDPVEIQRNARATLIICPKSVLSNWSEQIKLHTKKDKLKVYVYHGTTRMQDVDELSKYDIILTSYNTAAWEMAASGSYDKRALMSIKWFRVVLDEAHQIRTQTTHVSKACCQLAAQRRWAVTGTPVQNRLEDLGALIKFLRVKPFDDEKSWAQYILAPFKTGNAEVLTQLQLLVGSITLRRVRETVGLVDRKETFETLDFSADEQAIYDEFAKRGGAQLRQMTKPNGRLAGKAYAHILKAISRMRALCAHGKEMLSEEDLKELEGMTQGTAIELFDEPGAESEPFVTDHQAYETLHLLVETRGAICDRCYDTIIENAPKERIEGEADSSEEDTEETEETSDESDSDAASNKPKDHLALMTQGCYHFICPKCEDKHAKECESLLTADGYYVCPLDFAYVRYANFLLTKSGYKDWQEERESAKTRKKGSKWEDRTKYTGPHTKVKALLEHLQKSEAESATLPKDEPPMRSVVFSGWTTYLDLIQFALDDAGIGYTRLDGSMSVKRRTEVLNLFKTDPKITVLLVSIKAGGQGLNLTAANKVYMMEPQFNPGVEQQAIDRVHRLGQTRQVEITHFIMRDSIEGGIVGLQKKKEKLAQLSMERKRINKADEAAERIAELKSLFK